MENVTTNVVQKQPPTGYNCEGFALRTAKRLGKGAIIATAGAAAGAVVTFICAQSFFIWCHATTETTARGACGFITAIGFYCSVIPVMVVSSITAVGIAALRSSQPKDPAVVSKAIKV